MRDETQGGRRPKPLNPKSRTLNKRNGTSEPLKAFDLKMSSLRPAKVPAAQDLANKKALHLKTCSFGGVGLWADGAQGLIKIYFPCWLLSF